MEQEVLEEQQRDLRRTALVCRHPIRDLLRRRLHLLRHLLLCRSFPLEGFRGYLR